MGQLMDSLMGLLVFWRVRLGEPAAGRVFIAASRDTSITLEVCTGCFAGALTGALTGALRIMT